MLKLVRRLQDKGLTVDTAHLLSKHDGGSTIVGTSDARNREAIPETREVGRTSGDTTLFLIDNPRVVKVSSGNDGVCTERVHGSEGLCVLAVLHQPTGRLGTEPDTGSKDKRRDKGGAKLQAPRQASSVLDSNVCDESEEDANDDPQLPEHNEGAANTMRRHLGRENGDRGVLGTDANTHGKTAPKQALPRLSKPRSDGSGRQEQASQEDFSSSSEVVVERVDNESAAKKTN